LNTKGLQVVINSAQQVIPTAKAPVLKAGVEFANTLVKTKFLADTRTLALEHHLTYLARNNLVLGYNLALDSRS
jgi:hypothetical protein